MSSRAISASRRRLLQFLAASPLAAPALREAWGAEPTATFTRWPDPAIWAPFDPTLIIQSPAEASNVFDFEPACREAVPPAHFGYMTGGVEDGASVRDNREGFQKFQLLPRRLTDVSKLDMQVELFGTTWGSPVYACPVGGCMAYHPEGERAVSTAARAGNHMQMLSTFANTSIEEAIKARGGRRYRPALSVGPRRVRPGGRGARAGDRPRRNAHGDGAVRRRQRQAADPRARAVHLAAPAF